MGVEVVVGHSVAIGDSGDCVDVGDSLVVGDSGDCVDVGDSLVVGDSVDVWGSVVVGVSVFNSIENF